MSEISKNTYHTLKEQIKTLLAAGRENALRSVNTILLRTYWQIGKHIVEFEQQGKEKAEYGSELLSKLARDLTLEFGKGFSRSNLTYMRKLYLSFPKSETLSHKLSWSHYFEILKADDPLEMSFYIKQCETENWSVRTLKRQMKSMLFIDWHSAKTKKEFCNYHSLARKYTMPKILSKTPMCLNFWVFHSNTTIWKVTWKNG